MHSTSQLQSPTPMDAHLSYWNPQFNIYVTISSMTIKSSWKWWISGGWMLCNPRTASNWGSTVFTSESWTQHIRGSGKASEGFVWDPKTWISFKSSTRQKEFPHAGASRGSSEELKGSSLPLPSPPCHLHGDAQPWHMPEPEGSTASQHPTSSLDKQLPSTKGCWKLQIEGFAAGGGHSSASRDSSAPFPPPIHSHLCPTSFSLASSNLHPSRKSPALWDALPTQPGWNLWGY